MDLISWSGGKDSWLALLEARAAGLSVTRAITMFDETGLRSRSHGIPRELIEGQTAALSLDLIAPSASWETYEDVLTAALRDAAGRGAGTCVFGDIDLPAHRAWEEKVCAAAGLKAALPLWGRARADLVARFFAHQGQAKVVVTDDRWLSGPAFCGAPFDRAFIERLPADVDPCGEAGEFHTFVFDGTGFAAALAIEVRAVRAFVSEFGGQRWHYHQAELGLVR